MKKTCKFSLQHKTLFPWTVFINYIYFKKVNKRVNSPKDDAEQIKPVLIFLNANFIFNLNICLEYLSVQLKQNQKNIYV